MRSDEAHRTAPATVRLAQGVVRGDRAAVAKHQPRVGQRGELGIVRHQHQRGAAGAPDVEQQVHDVAAGRRVEVAGRLVGQHDRRIVGERARDRDALLLAARELRRIVMRRDRSARLPSSSCRARAHGVAAAGNLHRHQDVLERGQRRHEMEELEDEPDLLAAQPAPDASSLERRDVDAVDQNLRRSMGASSPASRPSSVDLPLPDGPTIATN